MPPTTQRPILAWFRRDLRLTDNPAWSWAASSGRPVVPVFVLDEEEGEQPIGGASRWWLHGSLEALDRTLHRQGSQLVLRRGNTGQVISD
ncbi:MAG: deoxyribodipyrimidine photo-lyase, partial [Holophagales bacterium]|nr:deoxyribodipyrimidine photo-lyase [Holophagales bacterium]